LARADAVDASGDGIHSVLSKYRLSFRLGCQPSWLSIEHELFTGDRKSDWPASSVRVLPHFLYPSCGKNRLQVSSQRGPVQMLKASDFRARDWLNFGDRRKQRELCRADAEGAEHVIANGRDRLRDQARTKEDAAADLSG
jgi:hypothetical protein